MGMCKGCGEVFPALEMNEGFCKTCDNEAIRKEVEINGVKNSTLISLKKDSETKNISLGFSWFFLLFGIFYPLVKGDFKNTLLIISVLFVASILSKVYSPLVLLFFISYIGFAFIYNKIYAKDLIKKGFLPVNEYSKNALEKNGINF